MTWTDLVALADLTGPAGTGLTNRGAWVSGADYSAGDYVFAVGTNGNSMFICQSAETFTSTTEPLSDSSSWVEFTAPAGADGREIELQASGTAIQWRYSGGSTWTDLVPLSELKGADGVGIPTGGMAGQFLAKASPEDHDAEWVDAPPGGGSSTLIGMLAANSANQATTIAELVNVTVETGKVYQFRFLAEVKPTSTSIGLKWGFTGSFGSQFIQALASYRESASGSTQKALRAKADIATFASSEAGNDGNLIEIKGLVHVITGGTFGIGYAVSTQYDYAGITRGASLVLEPIGAVSLT
ncbi:hypothetical protein ACFSVK_07710 [Azorhizophilus paspali]|uniref:hypothetical protein n=1 Tax=Azorhizophilus paspali TaxID=69963 RepID=UPI00362ED0D2